MKHSALGMTRRQACSLLDLALGMQEGILLGFAYWYNSTSFLLGTNEEIRPIMAIISVIMLLGTVITFLFIYRKLQDLCEKLQVKGVVPISFTVYMAPILIIAIFSKAIIYALSAFERNLLFYSSIVLLVGYGVLLYSGAAYKFIKDFDS